MLTQSLHSKDETEDQRNEDALSVPPIKHPLATSASAFPSIPNSLTLTPHLTASPQQLFSTRNTSPRPPSLTPSPRAAHQTLSRSYQLKREREQREQEAEEALAKQAPQKPVSMVGRLGVSIDRCVSICACV